MLLFQALSCANIFSISSSSEFLALVEVPILPVLTDGALASWKTRHYLNTRVLNFSRTGPPFKLLEWHRETENNNNRNNGFHCNNQHNVTL